MKQIFVFFIFVCSFCNFALALDTNALQKRLKELTSVDFKVVSNKPASDASLLIVQSPSGERLIFLASSDGSYIVPLNGGLPLSEAKSALRASVEGVSVYNKDLKDSNAMKVLQKYTNYTLKIPAATKTTKTTYMVLDTMCPYCLQEVNKLDSYLKDSNVEVLMVAFLGAKSQKRTAGYYEELQKVTSRDDKIKLLKKVFTKEYDPKTGNDKITKEITESTIAAGIEGVPYMIFRK
ncbi:hypothetical protein DCO58_11350 [Helicobacter saguini]|uniref:Uncharacterized protein n=1 Tax=Helicobacter saguini TaxID=1548018 RepID=A0A347W687_9HELI|nr:hypothetical protein [Helicobacter saguini]MWV61113.1 hypothetical protein [Helicobacter saguini]MWV68218.1 hypothetical protein [Helicobacter saguini]MWV70318.1 hypothetical protein [Helicobacter saguini]MWV72220.1 hypothetical protein [Helicobacter saguini]TLD95269.1 hypothetical protein LS64_002630 [Helicobacter saguini]